MEEFRDFDRKIQRMIKTGREEAFYNVLIILTVYSLLMCLVFFLIENDTIQIIIAIGIALGSIFYKLVVYLSTALEFLGLIRSYQIGFRD